MAKITYVSAWQKRDERRERDAIALWKEHGVLPPGVTPEERAREICCLAYDGKRLAAISTIDIRPYRPLLNKRFGFLRVFTSPEYEGREISIGLAKECRRLLEEWSVANPSEMPVCDMRCSVALVIRDNPPLQRESVSRRAGD